MKTLLTKILLLFPIPVVVFATNWFVDPANIKSDDSYEKGVASIVLSKRNVANLVNYKERKLQQKIILGFSTAPEVIVLGSSRSMQIESALFPGKRFFNNAVSGASIEDYLAVLNVYRKQKIKPELVVIGLDPWVLNRNNAQDRWRELYYEYAEMKSFLGLSSGTFDDLLNHMYHYKKYSEFFSPAYFNQSYTEVIQKRGHTGEKYWATEKSQGDEPIKMSDGSYVYGKKYREKSLTDINSEAKVFSKTIPIYSLGEFSALNLQTMQLLDKTINYLKNGGTRVLLFLPPYHPTVYNAIKTDSSYAMVGESEKWYRSLADKHKVGIVGSFDPQYLGLEKSDFYDGMHPKNETIKKIFIKNR